MRELKFRAWDTERDRWSKTFWGVSNDGKYVFKYSGSAIYVLPEKSYCKVMQYTGLLDKNGKEIYEGDIISHTWIDKDDNGEKTTFTNIDVIQFSELPAGDDADMDSYGYHINPWWNGDYVVIGNIYENPELLKENNNE